MSPASDAKGALVVVDTAGALLFRDASAERLLGDASLTTEGDFYLPDEKTPCPARDLPAVCALSTGTAVTDAPLYLEKDARHVLVTATPLHDTAGAVRAVACVVRPRVEAGQDDDRERHVRQERLALLGQLAGGVAHQIRNSLAAIMNATYVLNRHLPPERHSNVDDAMRIIHDEVRHANDIITALLNYARVRTPDRHPTSLVALVERAGRIDGCPDNIRIEHRSIEGDVVRSVDADQIQRAIMNLVRNAIDAMPDGGVVTIGLRLEAGEVVVSVSDTGAGISEHVRLHLFEPLRSAKPMGIGLGLVIARRLVEAHGGSISLVEAQTCASGETDEPFEARATGACFEIRLP